MSERPKSLRGVFLLTCLKIVISSVFLAVISSKGTDSELAQMILYTTGAYVVLAIPTFIFIHKPSGVGVRAMIALAILVGIPAKAFIGIAIDIIALGLTFTKSSKAYFENKEG